MTNINMEKAQQAVRQLLEALGEDPEREGLVDTPKRVAKMYVEQYQSQSNGLERVFGGETYDELVLVKNIPISSFCEHHLLPWYGKAHIGYIPNPDKPKLLGISKLARVLYSNCKGFTIQERVTTLTADDLCKALNPLGCMLVIEATHTCMSLRGAKALGATTITSAIRGVFKDKPEARMEFLSLIDKGG